MPDGGKVYSCQAAGTTPLALCGSTNLQARFANSPSGNVCGSTSTYSGQFLHVEQALTLRDGNGTDGWDVSDVVNALRDTWPTCNLNCSGCGNNCDLGAVQTDYDGLLCP